MATLYFPHEQKTISDFFEIQHFLKMKGIDFERWDAEIPLSIDDSQDKILKAYEHKLAPLMKEKGYKSADVINVGPTTPNIEMIRQKFLSEHIHSEDEVRFFVDGEGYFWFNLDNLVFRIHCRAGDFLSVPAGATHWFDLAPKYSVKAIRIFTSPDGWVANYTNSGIEKKYLS